MTLPRGCSLFYRTSKKRWVLSYADPVRGQPQKVLPREVQRERDAHAWALAWLAASKLDPSAALTQRRDEGPTVAACAEKWLRLREADTRVAPSTLQGNRAHLRLHILPTFGETPIAALDVPELRAWLRGLREKMSPKGARTVRHVVSTFAALFADAMAEGWTRRESNILDHPGVKRELPETEDTTPMRLPIATAQTLIESPVVPLERRARYVLAFTTGMRDGEIAGVTLGHLHLDAAIPHLVIAQSVAIVGAKGKGGWAKPKAPKTKGSKRTLPLHPAAVAALKEWIAEGLPALVGREIGRGDYLFPSTKGHPSRPKSAAHMRADLAAAGLPVEIDGAPVEFKASRSSFATWLDEAGVPQPRIKRLMGHAAADVTERSYTARDLEQLAAAVMTIPLVWLPEIGTRPAAMTAGTRTATIDGESRSHLRDLNSRPTVYERVGRGVAEVPGTQWNRRPGLPATSAPKVSMAPKVRRIEARRGAGTRPVVPPELARARNGLAALRRMEDAFDAFFAAADLDPGESR